MNEIHVFCSWWICAHQKLWGSKGTKGWNMIPQSFALFPFAISLCCHFFYPPTSHSLLSSMPWYGLIFFRPESVGRINLACSKGSWIKISITYPNLDLHILLNFEILNCWTEVMWPQLFPEPSPKPWKIGLTMNIDNQFFIDLILMKYIINW